MKTMRTIAVVILLIGAAGCRLGDRFQGSGGDMAQLDTPDMTDDVVVDMTEFPDMAGVCGASGDGCCMGNVCNPGLACLGGSCAVTDVFAINGITNRWDGAKWSATPTPPAQPGHYAPTLDRLWGSGANDIWAVGGMERSPGSDNPVDPATYHWDGTAWKFCATTDPCGVPAGSALAGNNLMDIFGLAADDIWVLGSDGAYHWNGSTWTSKSSGLLTGTALSNGLWCAATDDCWAAGAMGNGTLLQRWTGSAWTKPAGIPTYSGTLQRIWGWNKDDAWAVGATGNGGAGSALLLHWNGTNWSTTFYVPELDAISDVWGITPSDTWVVGALGKVAHWDGTGWTARQIAPGLNFRNIWGASSRDIWITSDAASIIHYNGSNWTSTQATGPMFGMWGAKP